VRAFLAALRADYLTLYRTGYLAATGVIFAILLALLWTVGRFEADNFADLVAAVIVIDQVAAAMMLVGLMILLEREDGAIAALAVSPAPPAAWLASKAVATASVGFAEMALLALLAYDGPLSAAPFLGGLAAIGLTSAIAGVVVVAAFDTLHRYLLPMIAAVFALSLPAYAALFGFAPAWMAAHPLSPAFALIEAGFAPAGEGRLAYGAAGALAWLIVAWAAARAALSAMRRGAAGG